VNAASTGETVLVADGTYAGFAYNNKDIIVESVNGPSGSTIQQPGGYAVDFNYFSGNSSDSTITGFTISNSTRGVMSNMSDVWVDDCIFENNTYGIYHQSNGSYPIEIRDSVFRTNTTAGIINMNNTAVVDIYDCEFTANTGASGPAINIAGGVWNVERSTFDGNTSTGNGGALWANGITNLHISDSTFTDNTSGGDGGALYFAGNGSATDIWVDRSVIAGNDAVNGGAIRDGDGDYWFTNCNIVGNYASGQGGGLRTTWGSNTYLTNCAVAGNSGNVGGGMYMESNSFGRPDVLNSIMWGNDSRTTALEQIDGVNLNRAEVRYTDIDQTYTGFYNQAGNMTANPLFVAPALSSAAPTTTGDYHLQALSPCEGQASLVYAPPLDIDGGLRPAGTGDDMGSDEIGVP
jgi:predicted outer membrane repeat protein